MMIIVIIIPQLIKIKHKLSCKGVAKRYYTAVGFHPEIISFHTFIAGCEFSGKFGYVLETGALILKNCLKILESLSE